VPTAAHSNQSCLQLTTAAIHSCQLLHTANKVAFTYTPLLDTGANSCIQQKCCFQLHTAAIHWCQLLHTANKATFSYTPLHTAAICCTKKTVTFSYTHRSGKKTQATISDIPGGFGGGGVQPTEISRSEENKSVTT
jgi:hypothetical protein